MRARLVDGADQSIVIEVEERPSPMDIFLPSQGNTGSARFAELQGVDGEGHRLFLHPSPYFEAGDVPDISVFAYVPFSIPLAVRPERLRVAGAEVIDQALRDRLIPQPLGTVYRVHCRPTEDEMVSLELHGLGKFTPAQLYQTPPRQQRGVAVKRSTGIILPRSVIMPAEKR